MKEKPFSAGVIITLIDSSGSRGMISLRKPEDICNQFQEYVTACQKACEGCDPGENILCEAMNSNGKAFVITPQRGSDIGIELDKGNTPCTKYSWTSNHE
jgi:hypothetical protein